MEHLDIIPENIIFTKIEKNSKTYEEGKNNIKENNFMSENRKKYFIKNCGDLWKSKNNNTNVFLFLEKENVENYREIICKVFTRTNFMRLYAKNIKPLEIWIYPSPYKKIIPRNNIITTDDINSGSTVTYTNSSDNGVICLWRKEELLKVLVHEIIHSFRLDKDHPFPNEAYVELKALIANIYLECLDKKIPLTKKNIQTLLDCEKRFGIYQSLKIKNLQNNNTNIEFYINEKARLLNGFTRKKWENLLLNNDISKPNSILPNSILLNLIPEDSLRFTITELILLKKNKQKKINKILYNGF